MALQKPEPGLHGDPAKLKHAQEMKRLMDLMSSSALKVEDSMFLGPLTSKNETAQRTPLRMSKNFTAAKAITWDKLRNDIKTLSMPSDTGWTTTTVPDVNVSIGNIHIKLDSKVTCKKHGEDVGLTITMDGNTQTPTMKLQSCRYCLLEGMAKNLGV